MTTPIQNVADPEISLQDWLKILHNAARVKPGHPRYAEARQVTQMALANIRGQNQAANIADRAPSPPSAGASALVGAGQGATSGFADELVGALSAIRNPDIPLTGVGIGTEVNKVREAFSAARSEHPFVAGAANVAGSLVNPLARLLPAPTSALKGAFGGATLGGAQGLGEGEGSLGERLPSAGVGAAVGAIGGAIIGKLVKRLSPLVSNTLKRFRAGIPPGTPAAQVAATEEIAVETAVRTKLQKDGYPSHIIERIIQTMKVGKQIPTAPGPQVPVAQRPGETVVTQAPRAHDPLAKPTFMRRGGSVRQDYIPTTGNRYVTGVDLGKGQTLPYYSRGGKVEQSLAPFPVTSPSTPGPNQNAIFIDYLRGATPQDVGTRVATLRDLGVPLPQDAEAQILQLLLGAR